MVRESSAEQDFPWTGSWEVSAGPGPQLGLSSCPPAVLSGARGQPLHLPEYLHSPLVPPLQSLGRLELSWPVGRQL